MCAPCATPRRRWATGRKTPAPSEAGNRALIRKSLVCAVESLEPGVAIEPGMLAAKRPMVEGAVLPGDLSKIVGLTLRRPKSADEPIFWTDFHG